MIRSMTAYARREIKNNWGNAIWEIRSVNQRYLEINFRLPDQFRNFEPIMRERIRSFSSRGKIECVLHFKLDVNLKEKIILNKVLIKQLINAINWLRLKTYKGKINLIDILKWPGAIKSQEQEFDSITKEIIDIFNEVANDFFVAKKIEGRSLKVVVENNLRKITSEINKIRTNMPDIINWQRRRLVAKLEDARINFDIGRLEQELVFITQRIDITEELDRLEMHVQETLNILNKQEIVGRHLDFMMQELNRESNTLASKSINIDITNAAIQLKVLIEQIREQIQNIE